MDTPTSSPPFSSPSSFPFPWLPTTLPFHLLNPVQPFPSPRVHGGEDDQKKTSKKRKKMLDVGQGNHHPCGECGRHLRSSRALSDHNRALHLHVTCTLCPVELGNKAAWRVHMAEAHPTEISKVGQLFQCSDCPRVLTSQSNLVRHRRSFHDPVPCEVCGVDVLGTQKRRHMLKLHKGVQICPQSPELAKRRRELKELARKMRDALKEQKRKIREEQKKKAREEKRIKKAKKKETVTVPLPVPIGEMWFSAASSADDIPQLGEDSNLFFDPFEGNRRSSFVDQLFQDTNYSYASTPDDSGPGDGFVQLELVDEIELLEDQDDGDDNNAVMENLMFCTEGDIPVSGKEIVLDDVLKMDDFGDGCDKSPSSRQCLCCGASFFLDLDYHLHICDDIGELFPEEWGNVLALPADCKVACWEQVSKMGGF